MVIDNVRFDRSSQAEMTQGCLLPHILSPYTIILSFHTGVDYLEGEVKPELMIPYLSHAAHTKSI